MEKCILILQCLLPRQLIRLATPTDLAGPSACGPLGFALADSEYADHVIVVTDNLVRISLRSMAHPREQRRLGRRGRFLGGFLEDRFRHNGNNKEP